MAFFQGRDLVVASNFETQTISEASKKLGDPIGAVGVPRASVGPQIKFRRFPKLN